MTNTCVMFVGAGDLAGRAITQLQTAAPDKRPNCIAISRSAKQWQGAQVWQGDVADAPLLAKLVAAKPAVVVVTLVPNGEGEAGYRRGYYEPLQALVAALVKAEQNPLIIFASSTGVYHQTEGEWVDEQSSTEPTQYSGQCMLACEQLLAASNLPFCSVRFGGIYGPRREFLIRQVQAGKGGGDDYSNRIHSDDAAGVLVFLIQRYLSRQVIAPLLVACDSLPATSREVRIYISQQLGMDTLQLQSSDSGRGGNKRCSNQLLLALGYVFLYPSFIEGYKNAAVY